MTGGDVHRSGLALAERWIESFDGRLRDELLNSWRFDSLREARVIIEDWRLDYKADRPHSAHGELTPTEFARAEAFADSCLRNRRRATLRCCARGHLTTVSTTANDDVILDPMRISG